MLQELNDFIELLKTTKMSEAQKQAQVAAFVKAWEQEKVASQVSARLGMKNIPVGGELAARETHHRALRLVYNPEDRFSQEQRTVTNIKHYRESQALKGRKIDYLTALEEWERGRSA